MQLDAFVKNTLLQVVKGVTDAQQEATPLGATINPRPKEGYGQRIETVVSFDVALTVTDSNTDKAGGKIAVASVFSIGGGLEESNTRQETSRVQFEVTVALPTEERLKSKALVRRARQPPRY